MRDTSKALRDGGPLLVDWRRRPSSYPPPPNQTAPPPATPIPRQKARDTRKITSRLVVSPGEENCVFDWQLANNR